MNPPALVRLDAIPPRRVIARLLCLLGFVLLVHHSSAQYLLDTGQAFTDGAAVSDSVSIWFLSALPNPASPGTSIGPSHVVAQTPNPSWYNPTGASWIGPPSCNGSGATSVPAGVYSYGAYFNLPDSLDLNSLTITFSYAVAGTLQGVLLNGVDTGVTGGSAAALTLVTLSAANASFQPGANYIQFNVDNASGGPSGFLFHETNEAFQPFPANASTVIVPLDQPFRYQIETAAPTSHFTASNLPPGLALNAASGLIQGTAASAGVYPVTLTGIDRTGASAFLETGQLSFEVTGWNEETPLASASPDTQGLTAIAFGGGAYVAIGSGNAAFTSKDAAHWTLHPGVFSAALPQNIAFGDGLFVAGASDGHIYTSTDGAAWALHDTPASSASLALTAEVFGHGLFVAVGFGASFSGLILSSVDGMNWTDRTPAGSSGGPFNAVAYRAGRFLAVGDYNAATSLDGIHWRTSPLPPGALYILSIVSTELGFVVGGLDQSLVPFTSITTDGLTWGQPGSFSPLPANGFSSIAYAGGTFVAAANRPLFSGVYFSRDGVSWAQDLVPAAFVPSQSTSAVCSAGGHFLIAGADPHGVDALIANANHFAPSSAPAFFSLSAPAYQVHESQGAAEIVINRTGNPKLAASVLLSTGTPDDAQTEALDVSGVDYTIGPNLINAETAVPGEDYLPVSTLVTFAPGEASKSIAVPILDRYDPSAGRREIALQLTLPSELANPGEITQAILSILNDEVAVEVTGTAVTDVWPPNPDYSTNFLGSLTVENFGSTPSGPIQVKLMAHPGFINNTFDRPLVLPADVEIRVFPASASIAAHSAVTVDVNGTIPAPQGDSSQSIFWLVYAVVEQQSGGAWYDSPSAWAVIDGAALGGITTSSAPSHGSSSRPGRAGPSSAGGVVQASTYFGGAVPAFTGQQTPALASVSLSGPDKIDEYATGSFAVIESLTNGFSQLAASAAWSSSQFDISSAGVLTAGTVNVPTNVIVTGTVAVGGVSMQASKTVEIVPVKPGVAIAAVAPYARRVGSIQSGAFQLSRTGSTAHTLTVAVNVTSGGAGTAVPGTDYTALPATVTFAVGNATADVSVSPLAPSGAAPDETVQLNLSPVSPSAPYTLRQPISAVVTIIGTDSLQFASSLVTTQPGVIGALVNVQRDPNEISTNSIAVNYTTADGTAIAGTDYQASSGTLTFAGGPGLVTSQSLGIPLLNNPFADGNRSFTITLTDPQSGACLGDPAGCTVTIGQTVIGSPASLEGAYYGISSDSAPAFLKATVGRHGALSAAVHSPTFDYTVAGAFDAYGYFSHTFPGTGGTAVRVELQENPNFTGAIAGRIVQLRDGSITGTLATLQAAANGYSTRPNPFLPAGTYTMLLPRDPTRASEAAYPQGDGYAVVKFSAAGVITAVGVLGDGQPFTLGSGLSAANQFPFYLNPYRVRGLVAGSLTFVNTPGVSDFGGALAWTKPPQSAPYPAGFTATIAALGSYYAAPPKGQLLLPINPNGNGDAVGTVHLGNTAIAPLPESVTVSPADKVTVTPPSSTFALTLSRSAGYFSGRFLAPGDHTETTFKGVIFQKQTIAQGFFLRDSQTGYAELGQ